MSKADAYGMSDNTHTYDGKEIVPGLRVFTNDWEWGTVDSAQFESPACDSPTGIKGKYFDGWYKVTLDSGRHPIYNGERMTTVKPDSIR